jgi:hypothetical protein
MLEIFFFILGLINSVALILVFILRKNRLDLVRRFGWIYLLLILPAVFGVGLASCLQAPRYAVFLGIFLAFLLLEWLFDHILSPVFQESWRQDWRWLTPYLILYYAMNYGFVVMPWKHKLIWGLIMFSLAVIQISANLWSHPWTKK